MSSRIIPPEQLHSAEPLQWKRAGAPSVHQDGSGDRSADPAPQSHGPTWEEYKQMEARIRELESQLPLREQQARQAGQREAEEAANARWQGTIEKAARSITEISGFRGRLRREAEEDVVRLSMAVARRVLRRELATDPEALLGLVKTAMERLDIRETHRVRVRPEDSALVSAHLDKIGGPARIEVLPDTALERGALLFETERGTLDASADTQLQEIERGFADLLERRRNT